MFEAFETKARFVRTARGARRYGLPIGAMITGVAVPDIDALRSTRSRDVDTRNSMAATRSAMPDDLLKRVQRIRRTGKFKKLEKAKQVYEGYRTYTYGKEPFHIGKHEGKWIAMDSDHNIITEADYEAEALFDLEDILGIARNMTDATVVAEKARLADLDLDPTPENLKKFKEIHGKPIPPGLYDVKLTLDPDATTIATGFFGDGTRKWILASAVDANNADVKFTRVKRLMESGDRDKIEREGLLHGTTDDTAAALLLMLRTGIRVGSTDKQRGKADVSFGTTTLRGSHVRFNKESVRIEFNGKDQVKQAFTIKDPDLVEIFQARRHIKGDAKIFADTSSAKTIERMREVTGSPDYKNHDLRTALACEMALDLVERWKRKPPKTKREYQAMSKEVSTIVSKQLGNDAAQAKASYIDPSIWEPWKSQFEGEK